MLAVLGARLQDAGIKLGFTEMKDPMKKLLKRYGLFIRSFNPVTSFFSPPSDKPSIGISRRQSPVARL